MKLIDLFEQKRRSLSDDDIILFVDPKRALENAKIQANKDFVDEYVVLEITVPDRAKLEKPREHLWGIEETGEVGYRGRIPRSFVKIYKQGKI